MGLGAFFMVDQEGLWIGVWRLKEMSDSVIVWLALAVLVFWAMGAYNRLVRLRSQGLLAFTALAGELHHYVQLVKSNAPDAVEPPVAESGLDDDGGAWAALAGAAEQLATALKVAHGQPFNSATTKTLRTTLDSLSQAWARLQGGPADPAVPVLPQALLLQWAQVSLQADRARNEFNQRVVNYNEAIRQFPALLLAWVVGFKPAQPI